MRPTTFIISVLLCCVYLPSAFGQGYNKSKGAANANTEREQQVEEVSGDLIPAEVVGNKPNNLDSVLNPTLGVMDSYTPRQCDGYNLTAQKIECEKKNLDDLKKLELKFDKKKDKDGLAKLSETVAKQEEKIAGLESERNEEIKTDKKEHGGTADKTMEDDSKRRKCGDYGGLDCNQTTGIHEGIRAGIGLVNNAGASATSLAGVNASAKVSKKGSSATNSDFTDANRETLRFAGWQNSANSLLTMGASAIQFMRGGKHKDSAIDIEKLRDQNINKLDGELEAAKEAHNTEVAAINADKNMDNKAKEAAIKEKEKAHKAELASIDKKKANVYRNSDDEIAAQEDAKSASRIAAGVTMLGAANQAAEAARMGILMKNQAAGSETTADAPVFSMSNQGGQVIDPGSAINPNDAVETAAVNTSDTGMANEKIDGGLKDFDPNFGNNNVAGQAPGEFKDAALTSAPGGGSSPGGSGGTSAARDSGDGKQDAVAGKPQSGGKYEGGDGGGSKFSRGGGGGGSGRSGVGLDGGFADLLKRMLPGGADDKAASKAAIGLDNDRTPASDRAAVISREKNIFKEISKRYLKKNSEGAVLFQ